MVETHYDIDLKASSDRIGKLYPVLLDRNGNVIDGEHRLHADKNWPTVRLEYIESDRNRLLARLVCNVCRRKVSSREKTAMLRELGELYLKEGTSVRKVAQRLADEVGMSYRWVMKYLPEHLKARPGLGGPSMLQVGKSNISGVARCATEVYHPLFSNRKEVSLKIREYSNTPFVNIILEAHFYERIKRISENLQITPDIIIIDALMSAVKNLERLTPQEFQQEHS